MGESLSFRAPLQRVKATNFLSLEEIEVELGGLNVLVGPNGSGKTNFLNIFSFIGAIADSDLMPAINRFGGVEGISFQNSPSNTITISISGTITRLSHKNAQDEYKLQFEARPIRPRSADIVFRHEELRFKRLKGKGRRITIGDTNLEIFDRSTRKKNRKRRCKRNDEWLSAFASSWKKI